MPVFGAASATQSVTQGEALRTLGFPNRHSRTLEQWYYFLRYNSIMASARLDGLEEGEKKATIPPIRFLQAALKIPVAEVEELMQQSLADLQSLQASLQQQVLTVMSAK